MKDMEKETMEREICKYKNFEYLLQKPCNFSPDEKYPIIIVLHGAGARGNDISLFKDYVLFRIGEEYIKDSVVVMPQCFADSWFEIFEQLKDFINYAIDNLWADKTRVYVMGASMGAYATWQVGLSMPEKLAAMVPICGGGMYWNALRLKDVPIWAIHGEDDPIVFCEESKKMTEAVNNKGGNAKLTILKGVGHNAWDYGYADKEVFDWMFSQRKKI